MHQQLVEKVIKEGDGDTKRVSQIEGEVFAVTANVNESNLELICFDVLTVLESASAGKSMLSSRSIPPLQLDCSLNHSFSCSSTTTKVC